MWRDDELVVGEFTFDALRCGPSDGETILLLHGWPESNAQWRDVGPILAEAGYDVVAPNLRGYAPGARPAGVEAYGVEQLSGDVVGMIEALGTERVHLVGHDWGGIIAWAVAATHPEILDRLVVLNAPHMQVFREQIWRGGQFLRSTYAGFFQLPRLPELTLAAGRYKLLRSMFTLTPIRPGAFGAQDIDHYVRTLAQPGALTAALDYYRANARPGAMGAARGKVTTDTMVIWGERDPALSTVLLDGLQRYVPRLCVHRIPDAGHWVQNEVPAEVNRLLLGFLGRPAASPGA